MNSITDTDINNNMRDTTNTKNINTMHTRNTNSTKIDKIIPDNQLVNYKEYGNQKMNLVSHLLNKFASYPCE